MTQARYKGDGVPYRGLISRGSTRRLWAAQAGTFFGLRTSMRLRTIPGAAVVTAPAPGR